MISFTTRIRYFIGVKIGITCVVSHNYVKMKVYLYDSFTLILKH